MTRPVEETEVVCAACQHVFTTWTRRSIDLQLEPVDEAYIERMSTATCPAWGHVMRLGTLVVRPDGAWEVG